jgi:hypothetical protein
VPARDDHDYRECEDEDCPRFPCKVYKEGWRDCWPAAYEKGRIDGYGEGYDQGFPDGIAACPREHK